MNLNLKSKVKDGISRITIKRVIIFVVMVIAIVAVYKSSIVQNKFFASKAVINQNTTMAKTGNLNVIVAGSGPIYFTNDSKIFSKIGATVTKVNYKEGDLVQAGDIIYELDDTDAQTTVNSNLNSYKQNQISAGSSDDAVNNLSIKATSSGLVSDMTVNLGDTVQKGGTVGTIADTAKLKVLLTYNAVDIGQIALGQSAKVYITSLKKTISGSVTNINNQSTGNSSGGQSSAVEIQIANPGDVLGGMTASADIVAGKGTVSSAGTASLDYVKKQNITSSTGGTVQSIFIIKNQKVSLGQVLIKMKNADVTRAKENSDLQLANAKTEMDLKAKQLNNYKIIAPIAGVITKITNKVGDTIKAGDEISDVSDPTQMQFDVAVDELDIAKVKVGQKASITVDALPDTLKTPVTGEVAKVAVTGVSASGVTTFIVTVKVNDNLDKLKGGMNANGEIEVANKENVLYVPIEAITTLNGKSFVHLKGASGSAPAGMTRNGGGNGQVPPSATNGGNIKGSDATANTRTASNGNASGYAGRASGRTNGTAGTASNKVQNYYDGSILTEVQVGLNNDTSIEITSGLKEGDVVVLPETKAASTTTKAATTGVGGMGGGSFGGGGGRGN